MSDAPHVDNQHRRPHAPPMAAPFLEFDLEARSNSSNVSLNRVPARTPRRW